MTTTRTSSPSLSESELTILSNLEGNYLASVNKYLEAKKLNQATTKLKQEMETARRLAEENRNWLDLPPIEHDHLTGLPLPFQTTSSCAQITKTLSSFYPASFSALKKEQEILELKTEKAKLQEEIKEELAKCAKDISQLATASVQTEYLDLINAVKQKLEAVKTASPESQPQIKETLTEFIAKVSAIVDQYTPAVTNEGPRPKFS